jgi:hypothetical protein
VLGQVAAHREAAGLGLFARPVRPRSPRPMHRPGRRRSRARRRGAEWSRRPAKEAAARSLWRPWLLARNAKRATVTRAAAAHKEGSMNRYAAVARSSAGFKREPSARATTAPSRPGFTARVVWRDAEHLRPGESHEAPMRPRTPARAKERGLMPLRPRVHSPAGDAMRPRSTGRHRPPR